MKKQVINFSWPAQLSDFAKDTVQENFSRGRLKVFYKGETADHRFFSDSFSEELIKSLPYTPVVSYYDEEKEDFVGHATEQQILGIVDPCVAPSFEEDEDGKVWCICDCVFYTERPDRVGDLAKKIEGHKQSLELDPSSVQYKINYDEKKHFKNIEFTAGRFVGVSVLGNDQKPAFSGSAFFACDENFESKMKILREYCEKQNDQLEGGNEMNLQEFMKLSWGEVSTKVEQAVAKEYQNDAYCYIVDMFEDSAIVRFYYYMENGSKLMKINYTCDDNGNVCLGDIVEVRVTYEEVVEVSNTATTTEVEEVGVENATEVKEDEEEKKSEVVEEKDEKDEEEFVDDSKDEEEEEVTEESPEEEEDEKDFSEEKDEEEESTEESEEEEEEDKVVCAACGEVEEEEKEADSTADAADVSNAEVTEVEREVSDGIQQDSTEETNTSSASFTDSERAEFEALKREKKVNILNSYKEILSEEEFNGFLGSIDSFEEKDLEIELLKAYKASKDKEPKIQRAFAFAPILEQKNAERSSLDDFIKRNL